MPPTSPAQDVYHRAKSNVIAFSQRCLAYPTRRILGPHCANLRLGQFCQPLFFAVWAAALGKHVSDVVGIGSEVQVIRSDARAHITAVQDPLIVGNGSVLEFPRNTVRSHVAARHTYDAVTCWVESAGPEPAARCLVDLSPEAGCERPRPTRTTEPLVAVTRAAEAALFLSECDSAPFAYTLIGHRRSPVPEVSRARSPASDAGALRV